MTGDQGKEGKEITVQPKGCLSISFWDIEALLCTYVCMYVLALAGKE